MAPAAHALRAYRVATPAAAGLPAGAATEVLLLAASSLPARRHVLFFPGDAQMRRTEMEADVRHGTFEFSHHSLDDTLPRLQAAFGADAHVWAVRPLRMVYQFACYQQFARVSLIGAAQYDGGTARAADGISALLEGALAQASGEGAVDGAARELPLVLAGFSKGCVVLNQLLAELGAGAAGARALFTRAEAAHWIDGGNGSERGALYAEAGALDALAEVAARTRLAVHVHSSPYMLDSPKAPWVRAERDALVSGLRARGVAVRALDYFEDEEPSLERHFEVLGALDVEG